MNPIDTDNTTKPSTVKVWDWPVRVFHWTLAASVLGAFFTGENEDFERLHQTLGWVAAGLIERLHRLAGFGRGRGRVDGRGA